MVWTSIHQEDMHMDLSALNKIAVRMVEPKKRFDQINLESTESNRRDYREMLFRAEGMKHISGVILYDETIWQKAADGTPLVKLIEKAGAIPGIKVDEGTEELAGGKGDLVTKGLDGLSSRLPKYYEAGARFAKWRAVIDPTGGRPSYSGVLANAHALARYANLCQANNIVPIVEPEVLMDGDNDIDTCYAITEWVLKETFQQLFYMNVKLEGIVLKPNMIVPGKKSAKKAGIAEIAEKTVKCLKNCVPASVPGIAFLSGGQSDEEATANLSAMNAMKSMGDDLFPWPWNLTFSYGRALQHATILAWAGKPENVKKAQTVFTHRAKMNGLASTGKYKAEMERELAA
jgi:fructose-bisphosphate aldolase, class I